MRSSKIMNSMTEEMKFPKVDRYSLRKYFITNCQEESGSKTANPKFTSVVFNLWVETPVGVAYQTSYILDIYIMIRFFLFDIFFIYISNVICFASSSLPDNTYPILPSPTSMRVFLHLPHSHLTSLHSPTLEHL